MSLLTMSRVSTFLAFVFGTTLIIVGQTVPPESQESPPPQASEVSLVISGDPGTPPRYAVPDFFSFSSDGTPPDAKTIAAAKTIGKVLWDDLEFEREFYMIPRDTYVSIKPVQSATDVEFDRWRELGADALIIGSVEKAGDRLRVQVRLLNVRSRVSIFSKEYEGSPNNPRLYAHTISDEIHQSQHGVRGVARTRLTFSSDRDGESIAGSIEKRNVKEIYISDYDGANEHRVTVHRSLNIFPMWSADGRAISYTSYRHGYPDLTISFIYEGMLKEPQRGNGQNWLAAWSPDGRRIAFTSSRDGNPEIYVMNQDGTNTTRVTHHPGIDSTPTWSPSGAQIAFTSDRSGLPQIYVVGVDGLSTRRLTYGSYSDRPTWSPPPYNEIAYAGRTGPGFDIKVLDLASNKERLLTFGVGSNESPSYSPNGRHLAFTSTRTGSTQVYTIGRDGRGLRRVTNKGNNFTPNWSH